jgi:hypothetical protein
MSTIKEEEFKLLDSQTQGGVGYRNHSAQDQCD